MPNVDLPDFESFDATAAPAQLENLLSEYRAVVLTALQEADEDWYVIEREVDCNERVEALWSTLSHLHAVADGAEMREAYKASLEQITAHATWRQHNEGLWQHFRAIKSRDSFEERPDFQRRITELELRDFHLAGVDLSDEDKNNYRDLMLRLSELRARFGEHLQDATEAWSLHTDDPDRLRGLPAHELKQLEELARNRGKAGWLIDLTEPSYKAVMRHARDRDLRHELYLAYLTRASELGPNGGKWDNTPVIQEMLGLRYQLARLLGFEQYADLALATRMATDWHDVADFLHDLAERARPHAARQYAELSRFAEREGAPLPLQAWDIAYWSEQYRQEKLSLSDELLKPYFPLQQMLEALEFVIKSLFGVSLKEDSSVATWHRDARFFWLEDGDGNRLGGIYMDLYAREAKRGGAWMGVCRSRRLTEEGVQLPVSYLNCNFPPPVGKQPSLLTHDEMRTLFHEMGHCLHHLLTTVDWPQIGGINNVEWDAVELPSQLLENWCWLDDVLSRFARHYQTGEPLPSALKQPLLESRKFLKAMVLVRQLEFALLDWRLHSEYDPDNPPDLLRVAREVREEVAVVPVFAENRFLNGFAHLFGGGYAAGYYSYLWAEELAADAWGYFEETGTLSRDGGRRLRKEILSIGALRPSADSFRAFRGRDPRPEPLLDSYGVMGNSGAFSKAV